MPAQAYGIPLIFQDLRQEEALLQMFDSLEMLEKTVNDVYEKVANRVSSPPLDARHACSSVG